MSVYSPWRPAARGGEGGGGGGGPTSTMQPIGTDWTDRPATLVLLRQNAISAIFLSTANVAER